MAQQLAASPVLGEPAPDDRPTDRADHTRPGRSARGLIALLALAVAVAVGVALWSALRDGDGPVPALGAEIAEAPGAWYGKTVIVSGDVNDVVRLAAASNDDPGPAQGIAFTLGGDTPAQQVLVVRTGPESAFIDANSVVHVTGAVREFDVEAFNRAYGNADWFSGGRFEQWNGRAAIVAQSIDPTIPPEYIRP